jgi:hypothetical protein
MTLTLEELELYLNTLEELNMTDEVKTVASAQNTALPHTDPAGLQNAGAQAAGTQNAAAQPAEHPSSGWWKPGTAPVGSTPHAVGDVVSTSVASLEARLTELENVVHAIAPYSRNAAHSGVVKWVEKIGARIKAAVKL